MPNIDVNGQTIDYPETGDTNWSGDATNFAIQTSAALGKIGLSSGTSVDITQTLDVTGNTTLDANLSVGGDASVTGNTTLTGNLTVNGNTQLGNANTDTIGVTGIVNVDSGVLYVDPVNNRVGINNTTPSQALDVTGNVAITGNETVGGTLGVTGDVAINTNKFNVTASSGNTTIAGTLGVTSDITTSGILTASNSTNVTTAPPITFTGDTNTGIGRSATDTLDFITNGNSRFRIEPTGQIKAVYESQVGTDYNIRLDNGYLCRAWGKINQTGTQSISSSGNISSLVDGGNGITTFNFTNAMPDSEYSVFLCSSGNTTENWSYVSDTYSTGSVRCVIGYTTAGTTTFALIDRAIVTIGIFR